ncbi:MAG: hypothetical protein L0J63_01195 [Tetragenococcus koreensis]|nr:hypothetical protein [Tetragenococcus koreensis]
MLDLLDKLATILETELDLFTIIVTGNLLPESSIALVPMPSSRGATYYRGKRERNGLFQVLTKNKNQVLTSETLENICDFLEESEINIEGYSISNIEVYSEPHYIDGDRQSGWTYSAAIAVTYTKE